MKIKFSLFFFLLLVQFTSFAQQVHTGATIDDQFRKKVGNLRVSKTTLTLGKVMNNEVKTDTIHLLNAGKSDMTLTVTNPLPDFLKVNSVSLLKPGEAGDLVVTYDAAQRKDYGSVFDRFSLTTNDVDQSIKFFNITAVIREYFPPSEPGDTLVAKAVVSETVFDFGQIKQGEKAVKSFSFTNAGGKKLIVRAVKNSCGCIKTTLSQNELNPGESATLKVEYDSFAKEGKEQKWISVFFNDPAAPEVKLDVHGWIVK